MSQETFGTSHVTLKGDPDPGLKWMDTVEVEAPKDTDPRDLVIVSMRENR